jgi:hypothetical protein
MFGSDSAYEAFMGRYSRRLALASPTSPASSPGRVSPTSAPGLSGGAGPAGAWLVGLDDERRAAARVELYRQLGEPDGSFTLRARAWAVRATRA